MSYQDASGHGAGMSSVVRKISWDDFAADCKSLAQRITNKRVTADAWRGIIAVTRGGLVPAAIVARQLGIRVIETIGVITCATDDVNATRLHQASIIKQPFDIGDGTGWLIIDDLTDTGITFATLKLSWPRAHYAAPYVKTMGEKHSDTFVERVPQDVWLVLPWEEEATKANQD